MATRVYHWKHGWIPLDHTAALSKSKGSEHGARHYLAQSHAAGHTHSSVVSGTYGGGTHVRGLHPVAAEHLPRANHINAAFNPDTRKFALLDQHGEHAGLASGTTAIATAIPEHLALHLHDHGHVIEHVRKTPGGDSVVVRTRNGDRKEFKADGSDKLIVDAPAVESHAPAPAAGDSRPPATHTVHPSDFSSYSVVRPVNGHRGEIISRTLGDHLTSGDHRVIGYSRTIVTAVGPDGVTRRFKSNGSNLAKPVIVRGKQFARKDLAGFEHIRPEDVVPQSPENSPVRLAPIDTGNIKRAYRRGNKTVVIEHDVTDAQTEAFLNHVGRALDATSNSASHPVTIHVPKGLTSFRAGKRGTTLGFVYRGDYNRVHVNPTLLKGEMDGEHHRSTSGGFHTASAAAVHPTTYVVAHELGHTVDFKNNHTHQRSSFTAGGREHTTFDARGTERAFYGEHRQAGNLSRYGASQLVEGYAESFAHHHLRAPRSSDPSFEKNTLASNSYAERYGWKR